MHRLERLFTQVRKTNSVVKSYPALSRYLCSKDGGIKDLSEKTENKTVPIKAADPALEDSVPDAEQNEEKTINLTGFAEFYKKSTAPEQKEVEEQKTFAALLRNSKLIDLGDPEEKLVTGKVVHVVDDDLHIDFGAKFNCVCKRPARRGSDYVRGSIVHLRIKELELSTRFLGSEKDLTILEANCILLGLRWSPLRRQNREIKLPSEM